MVENKETFTIDFTISGEDASVRIVGTYAEVRVIYDMIKGNKSLWLENEYGSHPVHVNIEE